MFFESIPKPRSSTLEVIDKLGVLSDKKINHSKVKDDIFDVLSLTQHIYKDIKKYKLVILQSKMKSLVRNQLEPYIKTYIETGQIDKDMFMDGLNMIRESVQKLSMESIETRQKSFSNIHRFIEIKNKE